MRKSTALKYIAVTGLTFSSPFSEKALKSSASVRPPFPFELDAKSIEKPRRQRRKRNYRLRIPSAHAFPGNCPAKRQNGSWRLPRVKHPHRPQGHRFSRSLLGKTLFHPAQFPTACALRKEIRGIDFMTLYFTTETPEKCRQIFDAYKAAPLLSGEKQADFISGSCYNEKPKSAAPAGDMENPKNGAAFRSRRGLYRRPLYATSNKAPRPFRRKYRTGTMKETHSLSKKALRHGQLLCQNGEIRANKILCKKARFIR